MSVAPPDRANRDTITLACLLANAAGALVRLTKTARDFDDGQGDWLEAARADRPPATLMQNADLIRQSCECLEILLRNLAGEPLPHYSLSGAVALQGVYLKDLRDACLGIAD